MPLAGVAAREHVHRRGHQAIGVEARRQRLRGDEAAQEQRRADQQHQAHGHLRNHQGAAKPARGRPPLPLRPSSFSALIVCGARRLQRRREAEHHAGRRRDDPSANSKRRRVHPQPRSIGMSTGGTNAMITSMVQ